MTTPPDRSAFVAYAEDHFAAVESMSDFFALTETLRSRTEQLRAERNTDALAAVRRAAQAAYERLQEQTHGSD